MYYAYTFSFSDLNSVKGTATVMPVYRTVLEKTEFGVRQEATSVMRKPNYYVLLGQKTPQEHLSIPLMSAHGLNEDILSRKLLIVIQLGRWLLRSSPFSYIDLKI